MANVTHQLALFVCHLFIDGNFRSAHILYKPNVFEYNEFMAHIDSNCPEQMPLYLTDITQPWGYSWNQNESPYNVLQLIFDEFNPRNLKKSIIEFRTHESLGLYQIFALSSIDSVSEEQRILAFNVLYRLLPEFRVLILNCKSENVSIYLNHGSNGGSVQRPFYVVNQETDFNRTNLFDRTFEEYERMQSLYIAPLEHHEYITRFHAEYIVNYYQLHLNNSFIIWKDELYVTKNTNYYKELFRYPLEMDEETS